ncbi:endonuclease/exonuclease/phosphatase family protein [Dyadobacter arcticus]|uniref:Endonuclease/exonuclease/phosphatase family metal-dependent hydrolase n=1 Tax=Dyadobacter arcticus TaxID=1078754 RepID=A0ABX0UPD7_9BACT|nr:endonuclease/exonuclease/phosphatase family protein [Dyadobacter arcticus]NIJ54857.1 endonuclease/exonuclease/phosphatase family metal-dependent hydrolase [Dyadobacter arcticus]
MSFNIRHGLNLSDEPNLRDILRIISENKPDLIALQAVDSLADNGKVQFQLRQIAAQTGMYYLYGVADRYDKGAQGVGILSIWPFEKTQLIDLPKTAGADPKVLLCGLINVTRGLTFRFCNSRLEYASVMDRALQAAYINQMLVNSIQPVLIGMDMGARPNEQPYISFRKNWQDAAQGSQLQTWNEGLPGDRFDYIFALLNDKVRVKNYKVIRNYPQVSDHYPILATIEFW